MKHNIRHIVLLSVVLALIGVLVISSAAFAAGGGSQAHAGAYSQNGNTYGPGDGTGPIDGRAIRARTARTARTEVHRPEQ